MPTRVSPTERIRGEIDELFAEDRDLSEGARGRRAPRRQFLALDGASSESHDACVAFLRDLVARGPRPPLLVITDGAPGLIGVCGSRVSTGGGSAARTSSNAR